MWNRLLLLKAQLLGHEGIRRYGANTAWLMGEKVLRMFMGLFVGIWVARYLGPEQFGLLSYAQSFVFLFTAIATLGLDGIVVRELVKDNSQRNVLLGTAFTLKLIGSLCILPLLWLGVQFTSNDSYTNLLIFIIASGTIFQSFNVIDFYYQSSVLSKYVAFANTITLAISSIVKVVLILKEASLLAFAIVGVFDTVILALGLIYFYWQKTHHSLREWQFDKIVAKRLLSDSWPLIFGSIAASLYMQIDQIMIQEILGSESVGYYAVAVKLSTIWLFITTSLTSTFAPAIIKAKKIDRNLYINRMSMIYSLLVKISLIICITISISSYWIVTNLYGIEYQESVQVLNVYIWSILFVFLSNGSWAYYINEGLEKIASIRLVVGALINIVLNMYLIKYVGLMGAAYSTIISYSISSYFINLFFSRTRENFMLQTIAIMNFFSINSWKKLFKFTEIK